MLVFLDTEFTKFNYPELISLALVAEDDCRVGPGPATPGTCFVGASEGD